jgi:phosphate starvation-inducible membrane PsiE
MIVTFAFLALVGLARPRWHPRPIVVQWQALLAICAPCVMLTLTLAVDHARLVGIILHTVYGYATAGVAVTQTTTSDYHLVQRIIVFLFYFVARVKQIVAKRVQFGKVYAQVGYFE